MNKLKYLDKLAMRLGGHKDSKEIIDVLKHALPTKIKISKHFYYADTDGICLYFEIITLNKQHSILSVYQLENGRFEWTTKMNAKLSTMSVDYRWELIKIESN